MIKQAWDIHIILWLQNLGNWMTPIMEFFNSLGYGISYLIFVSIIYWCLDSKLGMRMAIFLSLTGIINSILKQAIHAPRPYWLDSRIVGMSTETSFGMPAGHAQAATAWLLAGTYLNKKWFWAIAISFAFLIGSSRAYLGAHFPSQIIVGWIIGGASILTFLYLEGKLIRWMRTKSLAQQLLFIFFVSFGLLGIGGICVSLNVAWRIPVEWLNTAAPYLKKGETLNPLGMRSIASSAGAFLGYATGAVLITNLGGYDAKGTLLKRCLRYPVGFICLLILFAILQALSPSPEAPILYAGWKYFESFLITFFTIFSIPVLFLRLKLADKLHT
jgi:membrane-associated phospholipid phosphatase